MLHERERPCRYGTVSEMHPHLFCFRRCQRSGNHPYPHRLPRKGELTLKGITERLDLLRPAASHHLKALKQAGIVGVRSCSAENYDYLTFKTAIEDLKPLFFQVEAKGDLR